MRQRLAGCWPSQLRELAGSSELPRSLSTPMENSRLYVQVFLERREMVRQYLDRYGDHPPNQGTTGASAKVRFRAG